MTIRDLIDSLIDAADGAPDGLQTEVYLNGQPEISVIDKSCEMDGIVDLIRT